ncbi:mandelate racemase/muconate lactonizing enzyme family protein [Ornithinicoccus hortensis]|uniref:L-alanine-DL-glutamate epimerase-like enolase superfamily enzyme n=1 Tax=Ornithinicoccus hortensis TaxID=82346 RepID=A0A542YQV8_9MICO|nr:mandelate racemase/muconate lactonizing enzyme family protein [Ornithinicoccus hortensis]TQL50485.1 L-alanine-DL-glutamate epimerase-like enolase superfamily enzyme [Ornithinicoccus hortensis]
MFRLHALTARVHRAPVRLPLLAEPAGNRRFVSCQIVTDGGITGFGVTGQLLPTAIRAVLVDELFPLLRGQDVRRVEAIHDLVARRLNQRRFTGVIASALAALDVALWDAYGRGVDRPVHALLGGHRTEVPAYVTFGASRYAVDELVEAARQQVAAGTDCLKMVVGGRPGGWREDAERILAVREAIGPDIALAIDANCEFTPLEAYRLARAVDGADLAWFEEPLTDNDPRLLADLRRRIPVPIATGQMEADVHRLRQFVDAGAVDILQANAVYTSGFTEGRRVADLASAHHLPLASAGGWSQVNMHLIGGLRNGATVEIHPGLQDIGDRIFPDAPQPSGGSLRLPDGPGLGMTVDPDYLEDTALSG